MARPRKDADPWYLEILNIISDGAWHDVNDVVSRVSPMIPPGTALRNAENNRARFYKLRGEEVRPRKHGNTMTAVQAGQRHILIETIARLRKHGRCEVEYITKGKRIYPSRIRAKTYVKRSTVPIELPAGSEHGTQRAYGQGCGCEPCRAAHRVYAYRYDRARRRKTTNPENPSR